MGAGPAQHGVIGPQRSRSCSSPKRGPSSPPERPARGHSMHAPSSRWVIGELAHSLVPHHRKQAQTLHRRRPGGRCENHQLLTVQVAQAAIAWVAFRGTDVVPLVGARTRTRLAEALGAVDVKLADYQLTRIEEAVPVEQVAGDRYHAAQVAAPNSER